MSLPATSWADVEAGDDPNLRQLLADSAIADLVTRAAGRQSSIASGYTTMGAGGRASAVTPLAPQAFEPTEPYGESTAGDVYRQRTGHTATSGIVHLGLDALGAGERRWSVRPEDRRVRRHAASVPVFTARWSRTATALSRWSTIRCPSSSARQ